VALRGNLRTLKDLKSTLRRLPVTVAHDIAQRAAPDLTTRSQEAFDSGQTVYGAPRPRGVDGGALTLSKSGQTRREIHFRVTGTIIRCVLGTRWAKYLIGKYEILPNGRIPEGWSTSLRTIASEEIRKKLP